MTKENFETSIKSQLEGKENISVADVIEAAYKIHAESTDIVWSIVSDRGKQLEGANAKIANLSKLAKTQSEAIATLL